MQTDCPVTWVTRARLLDVWVTVIGLAERGFKASRVVLRGEALRESPHATGACSVTAPPEGT